MANTARVSADKQSRREGPRVWLARLPFRVIVALRASVPIGGLLGIGFGLREVLAQQYIGHGFWVAVALTMAQEMFVHLLIVAFLGVCCALLLTMYDSMTRDPDRSGLLLLAVGIFVVGAYAGIDIFLRLGDAGSGAHLLRIVRATFEQAPPGRLISRVVLILAGLTILGQVLNTILARLAPTVLPATYPRYFLTLRAAKIVAWFSGNRLVTAGAVLVFLAGAAGLVANRAEAGGTTNVLLISIDTLRADHLGTYGYQRGTSPKIDAFANEAIVFENAFSQAPWTLPSHATMLTSLYPSVHRADTYSARLSPKVLTLPEILRENGYQTLAVTSHVLLTDLYGMDQGFARLRFNGGLDADRVTSQALDFLDGRNPNRPFFMLVHYFDVHADYGAPAPYGERFVDPAYSGPTTGARDNFYASAKTPEDRAHLVDLYDGEIAFTDEHVGQLIQGLTERGLFDETTVILTADHGEEFGEHGHFEHKTLYDNVLHVPLIIKPAGVDTEPARVQAPVALLDLTPTILAATLGDPAAGELRSCREPICTA